MERKIIETDALAAESALAETEVVLESPAGDYLVAGMIETAALIAVILALRFFLIRLIRRNTEILNKDQRRQINRVNNGATVLILVCLVFIWAPQLHTFVLSLTAVAVAIVLTTKEILMCLTGGFLRATTKPFDVGDWITVDGATGEVMRITQLATLMEEIDTVGKSYQFTGRTVQIPNSKFLTANVENANFIKSHIYLDVPVAVQFTDVDPAKMMRELEKVTEKHFAPFREEAVKFNRRIEKKAAVDFADPEPHFSLRTTDLGHYVFTARLFVPTRQAAQIGAEITKDFLHAVHRARSGKGV